MCASHYISPDPFWARKKIQIVPGGGDFKKKIKKKFAAKITTKWQLGLFKSWPIK